MNIIASITRNAHIHAPSNPHVDTHKSQERHCLVAEQAAPVLKDPAYHSMDDDDGAWLVVSKGPEPVILRCSPAWLLLTGFSTGDVVGFPLSVIMATDETDRTAFDEFLSRFRTDPDVKAPVVKKPRRISLVGAASDPEIKNGDWHCVVKLKKAAADDEAGDNDYDEEEQRKTGAHARAAGTRKAKDVLSLFSLHGYPIRKRTVSPPSPVPSPSPAPASNFFPSFPGRLSYNSPGSVASSPMPIAHLGEGSQTSKEADMLVAATLGISPHGGGAHATSPTPTTSSPERRPRNKR